MFGLGIPELVIIFGIAFLLFGAKRLPDLGKNVGKAIRDFKGALEQKPETTPKLMNSKEEPKLNRQESGAPS